MVNLAQHLMLAAIDGEGALAAQPLWQDVRCAAPGEQARLLPAAPRGS